MPIATDLDLTPKDIGELASADAITAFLAKLGYETGNRAVLSPEAIGLTGESAGAIKRIELLSEDPEHFLRVMFVRPRSLTARVRYDLARVLGKSTIDHLLILASDFDTLEFVLLDKRRREQKGPVRAERIEVAPLIVSVNRRNPTRLDLRTLRRLTWTCADALEQFDKLRSVFTAAAYTGEYFQNRGLFSDYFLRDRLRDDSAWQDNPSELFPFVRDSLRGAQARWGDKDKQVLRNELLEPLFKRLGFKPSANRPSKADQTKPDYLLKRGEGGELTAAFVYAWDRWLDGPDLKDPDTPEENPGACVVTALDERAAGWIIVTNGRLWRLYSRQAHARATNFYEVDLVEALTASGDADPNEAFRYWWLFFRREAFEPKAEGRGCWLDEILLGSREYAKKLGERLKDRIFVTIFPHLAQGFLEDRRHRLGQGKALTEEELAEIFEATLTLLYRLLFLLYAESRDLLPIREAPYHAASLRKIKEEIAGKAGVAESGVAEALQKAYSPKETTLYDRLCQLFRATDRGDPNLNVPTYYGGLFNTTLPSPSGRGAGGEGTKPHHAPLPPEFLEFARQLRQEHTDAEKLLWSLLRNRGLGSWKFRRQHPVEPYVLDFYCHDARLAVELDGGQHNSPKGREHDDQRSRFLADQGIRVIRFWNHDVLQDTETVLEAIWQALLMRQPSPSPPTPLPVGEGSKRPSPPTPLPGGEGSKKPSPPGRGLGEGSKRDQRIARFLLEHKVPDRYLALAIDRLARDQDERSLGLVFIDYKSLEVRHLGSIYEGLLEFKLKVADEDLTTQADKKGEKYIPLSQAKTKQPRRRSPLPSGEGPGVRAPVVVLKGQVYLSNDKAERKASGSYYTPDPIVEYIVANTVGPVLDEKLEALRPEFRKVRKTFDRHVQNAEKFLPRPTDGRPWGSPRDYALQQTYNAHKDLVEALFDLRVLDPAMGSGHFLVETVDFITDRLLKFLNQFPVNPVNFALDRTRASILESLREQGVFCDEKKLTDINLLKRHVLKRCIYGVDLNPMAVELAKVSLWLDCFTLGAPLNFLDHHLRCGNSLIGATFQDLEEATKHELFKLDYSPLLRAINHVLFVSRMADATAAEVHRSSDEYAHARQELAGYQIILDLLAARHFGHEAAATAVLAVGMELDLASREKLLKSLPTDKARNMVRAVEDLARRPDRRFFHWEIEFPEVFFGFVDANQRQIQHKDRLSEGSAGFDCVVGNPPYVRQEALKALKPYLAEQFESYHSVADLFTYFYDRASGVTRQGGYAGFITSGSWMKANFGGPLRAFLARRMKLRSVIDFGEWQPFPGAEMIRPSVVVLQAGEPKTNARVFRFLTKGDPPTDLSAAVASSPEIDTASLGAAEWRLEGGGLGAIFEKMLGIGFTLADYANQRIYRGVTNGLTEAFVIGGDTRNRIIGQDHSSREIIKPYLEGKHLRGWFTEEDDVWLIVFPKGVTQAAIGDASLTKAEKWLQATYSGLYEWLYQFRDAASKRQDVGDYWWELRACDYYDAFEQPKIVWPDISKLPRFSMDYGSHYLGNTGYVIPLEDYFLLGVLASWPTWFMISRICQPLRLRGGRWQYRLIRHSWSGSQSRKT